MNRPTLPPVYKASSLQLDWANYSPDYLTGGILTINSQIKNENLLTTESLTSALFECVHHAMLILFPKAVEWWNEPFDCDDIITLYHQNKRNYLAALAKYIVRTSNDTASQSHEVANDQGATHLPIQYISSFPRHDFDNENEVPPNVLDSFFL